MTTAQCKGLSSPAATKSPAHGALNSASALGCEFHGERTRRRRWNEDRDVARPFIPGPRRPRADAAVSVRLGDRVAVEPDQIHRALDAVEVQAIAAPGD